MSNSKIDVESIESIIEGNLEVPISSLLEQCFDEIESEYPEISKEQISNILRRKVLKIVKESCE